jgi:protein-tyrosine phosphatase
MDFADFDASYFREPPLDLHFVTERLAVGGAIYTAANMRSLADSGITHVVNLQREFDDRSIVGSTGVAVLCLDCADDFLPKPSELFWDAALFTLEALRQPGARVLFHCAAGIHRSPMMLLSILRVLGHEPDEASAMITSVRPQVDFPDVYLDSIEEFLIEYQATLESDSDPRP